MKAFLVAKRELGDLVADRSYFMGLLVLIAMPVILMLALPQGTRGGGAEFFLIFGVQAAMFPTFMTVNAAAASFVQDKEGQTLLPLLAAPIRDWDIVFGKLGAIVVPSVIASWLALAVYVVAASIRFGASKVLDVLGPGMLFSLAVVALLLVLTFASWAMIVASRVRTVRAAQQISGFLVALVLVAAIGLLQFVNRFFDGWLLVVLPLAILAMDVVALEITRRLWRRDEAIARI